MWGPSMIRRLLCRLFRLVPSETASAPSPWRIKAWDDVLAAKDVDPVWPIIAATETWSRHLVPAYRKMLVQTLFLLATEPDERRKLELQIQAQLINRLLEQPAMAQQRDDMLRERMYQAGEFDTDPRSVYAQGQAAGTGTLGALGGLNGR